MNQSNGRVRRNLIAGSLAALAGAFGLRYGQRSVEAVTAAGRDASLTFYGRRKPVAGNHSSQRASRSILRAAPGGAQVGECHTTSLCSPSPFVFEPSLSHPDGALGAVNFTLGSEVEFHIIHLADGLLFGIGGGRRQQEDVTSWAVVGGTGKFAGARGACVETRLRSATDDIELSITLSA